MDAEMNKMFDWIIRKLFPEMAAEKDREEAILNRLIEEHKKRISDFKELLEAIRGQKK
jgi:hypothetical protein